MIETNAVIKPNEISFPNIWATFEIKFDAKNFKKSPNLVTLILGIRRSMKATMVPPSTRLLRNSIIRRFNNFSTMSVRIRYSLAFSGVGYLVHHTNKNKLNKFSL